MLLLYQGKERKVGSWFAVEAVVWLIGNFFFEELGLYLYLIGCCLEGENTYHDLYHLLPSTICVDIPCRHSQN